MITTWGYILPSTDVLPNMLDVSAFHTFTGNKYSGDDDRINVEISAASAAIRNFVGWHLYPSLSCQLMTTISDRRITFAGADVLIQLPARYVTEVSGVTIGGKEYSEFFADPNGLLRVFNVSMVERYAIVVIDYTAGLSDGMIAPIQELIAHRVTHSLAVPAGITSEASGGVSVTYNAGWVNSARSTALNDAEKELLVPYKVQGVF